MVNHPKRIMLLAGNSPDCQCHFEIERRYAMLEYDGVPKAHEIMSCVKCGIVIAELCDKEVYHTNGKNNPFDRKGGNGFTS